MRAAYDFAEHFNRLRAREIPKNWGPHGEIRDSRMKALLVSRDLDRNNAWIHGLFNSLADSIIGRGIRPEPRIRMKRIRSPMTPPPADPEGNPMDSTSARPQAAKQLGKTFNVPLQDKIAELWEKWQKGCDTSGKRSFYELQWRGERELWAAGEFLIVLVDAPDRDIPLALEVVSAERLAEHTVDNGDGTGVFDGVEVGPGSETLAYHIWTGDPAEMTNRTPKRIPAERVIHVYDNNRTDSVRGFPRAHSSGNSLASLAKAFDYELTRMQMASAYAFLWKSGGVPGPMPGVKKGPPSEGPIDKDGNQLTHVEGGMFLKGGQNDDLKTGGPNLSTAFEPYTRVMLRQAACGFNVSYAFMCRDFSEGNFSSQRMGALEDRKHWRPRQKFQVDHFCEQVWVKWIEVAMAVGKLPAGDPLEMKAEWRPDGWDWVDPATDIEADKQAVLAGFKSIQTVCAEHGFDFYEVCDQLEEARLYAAEKGVVLDVLPPDPMAMMELEASLAPPPMNGNGNGSKPAAKGPPNGKKPQAAPKPKTAPRRF